MEYVHNNTQLKTISTLGYDFYIFTNTNIGGKTYKALEDEDRLPAPPFHIHKKSKKERKKYRIFL
jgi:hypothetical protein